MNLRPISISILLIVITASASSQPAAEPFVEAVAKRIFAEEVREEPGSSNKRFSRFCDIENSIVAERVFRMYGAMFVAGDAVALPNKCIFQSDADVRDFQVSLRTRTALIGSAEIKLQEPAMSSLLSAIDEASAKHISIVPLDGSIAGSRSYNETVRLWFSRYTPALNYWIKRGRITEEEAVRVNSLPLEKQVEKVIDWESQRLWFGTAKTASIFASVAPPGASQHLSMLAFDVLRIPNSKLVQIFNSYGWFQTVVGDPQHFTYLGLTVDQLSSRGLKPVRSGGTTFWVPDVSSNTSSNLRD
jgi:hypothetical protein